MVQPMNTLPRRGFVRERVHSPFHRSILLPLTPMLQVAGKNVLCAGSITLASLVVADAELVDARDFVLVHGAVATSIHTVQLIAVVDTVASPATAERLASRALSAGLVVVCWLVAAATNETGEPWHVASDERLQHGQTVADDADIQLDARPHSCGCLGMGDVGVVLHSLDI